MASPMKNKKQKQTVKKNKQTKNKTKSPTITLKAKPEIAFIP